MRRTPYATAALSTSLALLAVACGPVEDGFSSPSPSSDDILAQLIALDGVTSVTEEEAIEGRRTFLIWLEQPVDHDDPDGAVFAQQLRLLHKSPDAPMVLHTNGYFLHQQERLREPSLILDSNQLSVEHRYFWPSQPSPFTWEYLNIEQSAHDLHHVRTLFHGLYPSSWLSTGVSKGGMTALFYRRFYPDDVDGTVAYVAPISLAEDDPRYVSFVANQAGTPECRGALWAYQRAFMERKAAMQTALTDYAQVNGYTYAFLGEEQAIEHMALELPFAFWQFSGLSQCEAIPSPRASDQAYFDFMDAIVFAGFFSDLYVQGYMPYFYQASNELGYPKISEENISDLLTYPGTDIAPTYVDPTAELAHDPQVMVDILDWISSDGETLMLIYGSWDPWTAGQIPLGNAADSYTFMINEANHGASLFQLPQPQWDEALDILERWGGAEAERTKRPVWRTNLRREALPSFNRHP